MDGFIRVTCLLRSKVCPVMATTLSAWSSTQTSYDYPDGAASSRDHPPARTKPQFHANSWNTVTQVIDNIIES